jgi:MFS family permease
LIPRGGWHATLLAAVAFSALGAFPLYLVSAYSVRIRTDLGFSPALYGVAISAYFAATALSASFLGRLVERIEARTAMRGAALCACAAVLGTATAARSWLALVAFLTLGGVANSFAQVTANQMLATGGVARRLGTAFGAKQAAVPIAGLVAGSVLPPLSGVMAWRESFMLMAIVPALGVFAAPHIGPARGSRARLRRSAFALPKGVFLIAVAAAFGGAASNSLPIFVVDAGVTQGMRESTGAVLLAAGSAIAVLVRLSAGWYVDRRRSDGALELVWLMLAGSAAFGVLALAGNSSVLFIAGVLAAFGAGWGWPGLLYYYVVRRFPARPGAVTGAVISGAFFGTLLGPVTIGTLATRLSYAWGWALASAALAIAAAVIISSRISSRE